MNNLFSATFFALVAPQLFAFCFIVALGIVEVQEALKPQTEVQKPVAAPVIEQVKKLEC